MCTAICYQAHDHYFGRNLDLHYHYHEQVTVMPRNYPLLFRKDNKIESHYAMIGMATVVEGYPLYYDATNEFGLSIAGLNFPGNAVYLEEKPQMHNIAPFELTPWVLCQCKTVQEAITLLNSTNLLHLAFSNTLPLTPLHFLLADKERAIVIEPMEDGLHIFENPIGVLANNPPFAYQMQNLQNFLNLTREEPKNRFSKSSDLAPYSHGMGAIGLPGDLSSASRFVRAAFTLENALRYESEEANVSQFFHILDAVKQTEGCVSVGNGFEKTVYSSCCNTDTGVYYYTTYFNRQITAVDMHQQNLDSSNCILFPLISRQQIHYEQKGTA